MTKHLGAIETALIAAQGHLSEERGCERCHPIHHCPTLDAIDAALAALTELRKGAADTARLDWLAKNDVIQQEVGANGWRLPGRDFRTAIDAAREKGTK